MRNKSEDIQQFIVENLDEHERDIARFAAEHFKISRAAIAKHLKALTAKGWIKGTGTTKARRYERLPIDGTKFDLPVSPSLEEDVVWREQIFPHMKTIPENVLTICNYGFTEMLNNVKDHSESNLATIVLILDAVSIRMIVRDMGIGVFQKIMRDFKLHDVRHALLELSKGKLTSDAKSHSGQGIFFTSRMFDKFILEANGFSYCRFNKEDEWLLDESEESEVENGTAVTMVISRKSPRVASSVFEEYAAELSDYGFTKTHVPLVLARYEGEQLVSRSQAKRLLARVDQFKEVLLDFKDIKTIGQAFADEVFRVFAREHPNIQIVAIYANPEVQMMIERAKNEDIKQPTVPLFEQEPDAR